MKSILDNDFFRELTEKKFCELINLNNTSTYFYVCDDTIDINKMKNFSFFPTNLNEPIEFIRVFIYIALNEIKDNNIY